MPSLDEALKHLRELSSRPPSPAATQSDLRARVARRRRRQLALGSFVTAIAVVGVWVVVDRDQEVSTTPTGPTSTATQEPPGLIVEPSDGLHPNDEVVLTLPVEPDPNDVVIAQCGAEATTAAPDLWCQVVASGPADEGFRLRVQRVIQVSAGDRIDCAERPGRCLVGVRTRGQDFTAPISFDPDLPALGTPTLDAEALSNRFVRVTGSGFQPGDEVTLAQCRPAADQGSTDPVFNDCDHTRAAHTTADDQGRISVETPLYRDNFDFYSGWAPCNPCQVQAMGTTFDTIAVGLDASRGLTARPTIEIRPAGPYTPGQIVELHGSGFAPDTPLGQTIYWCRFRTDDPTTEAKGFGPDYANCAAPDVDLAITTSDTGTFTIPTFPLPTGPFGPQALTCDEPSARCGLAIHPGKAGLPYLVTEFETTSP